MTRSPQQDARSLPWGVHELRGRAEVALEIGPLTLRLREQAGEIWASYEREGQAPPPWTRWATAGWNGQVTLTPALPDRSLVVEPDTAFWLLRGAEARIYVRVPLWVHVEALGDDRTSLLKLPTVIHSDTWWGSFEGGELCYWLPTTARRSMEDSLFQPNLAVCPVQLVNHSTDSLPVEKIALRVGYLSLYGQGTRVWSDETRVAYEGQAEESQLEVGGEPPREAPAARLLAPPRLRMTRGLRGVTFARLRSLQGWI